GGAGQVSVYFVPAQGRPLYLVTGVTSGKMRNGLRVNHPKAVPLWLRRPRSGRGLDAERDARPARDPSGRVCAGAQNCSASVEPTSASVEAVPPEITVATSSK